MENDWKNSLSFDDKGNLTKSISNYRAIFTHDENLSQIRFDTFCQDDISFSPLFLNVNGNKVDEESVGKIQDYLEQTYQLRQTQNKVFELLKTTASERSYNPVQEFIRKEEWDGVPRIETAIIDYLGAEDTPLVREQTKLWFVAAVARAFEPGCKFDNVLTLPGPQRIGKSTFFKTIGDKWFNDSVRICKYLTKKYGLYISAGKMNVNRDKLRGREKQKYQFYDKVMRCKAQSADWQQFDKALRAEGLKLRFHYNNVNGKLMGIVFTDGKYTFSGKQLDNELKLSALTEKFGDLKQITHDNVHDWYEDYRQQLHYINDRQSFKAIDHAYPDFDKLFPNGKLPSGGYTSTDDLLYHLLLEYQTDFQAEHENSKDSKTSFVGLELLYDLLLMPYAQPLSIGGGGSGNNRGWRDLDDEDKEKYRFRFNYSHSNKPQFKRKR